MPQRKRKPAYNSKRGKYLLQQSIKQQLKKAELVTKRVDDMASWDTLTDFYTNLDDTIKELKVSAQEILKSDDFAVLTDNDPGALGTVDDVLVGFESFREELSDIHDTHKEKTGEVGDDLMTFMDVFGRYSEAGNGLATIATTAANTFTDVKNRMNTAIENKETEDAE